MSSVTYPVAALTENLNRITDGSIETSVDNINNPTPTYVQKILFELFSQFGFACGSMVTSTGVELEGLTPNEVSMMKDVLPIDNLLVAAQYFFSRVGGCDIQFGLLDLVDPKPQRLRKFLSVIVNFWLFGNDQYEKIEMVKDGVQKRAYGKQQRDNQIKEIRQKIADIRQSKAKDEMQAAKVRTDMAELDEELARSLQTSEEIKKNLEPVKQRLAEMKEAEEVYRRDIEKLEAVEKRLKVLVRADEMKHNLEQDLQKTTEDFDALMMQQEAYQKKETQLQQQEADIKTFTETLHTIRSHLKKVHSISSDLKAKETELESVRKSIALKDERLMQVLKESADLKVQVSSIKSKWTTKKSALESELLENEKKLNSLRQEMSEEDIIASELETRIRQTREHMLSEERSMKEEVFTLKQMFREIQSAIVAFNAQMDDDLELVFDALERLGKNYQP